MKKRVIGPKETRFEQKDVSKEYAIFGNFGLPSFHCRKKTQKLAIEWRYGSNKFSFDALKDKMLRVIFEKRRFGSQKESNRFAVFYSFGQENSDANILCQIKILHSEVYWLRITSVIFRPFFGKKWSLIKKGNQPKVETSANSTLEVFFARSKK